MSSHALALLDLPDELLLHIALQCDDVADVARFARTCTALHTLITHADHFWTLMLARHFNVCAGDDAAAAVDHRALYRAHCERLAWAWPAASDADVSHIGRDTSRVRMTQAAALLGFVRAAYTVPPLPRAGLSVVCVLASPGVTQVGLIAYDRELDEAWDALDAPEGVLRVHMYTLGGRVSFLHPTTRRRGLDKCSTAVYQPAGWCAGTPPTIDDPQVRRTYIAVDADRGRVYAATGTPERWLVAFDSVRLVRLGNLRVRVTLWRDESARIERVHATDAIQATLRALDAEYAEARRDGELAARQGLPAGSRAHALPVGSASPAKRLA